MRARFEGESRKKTGFPRCECVQKRNALRTPSTKQGAVKIESGDDEFDEAHSSPYTKTTTTTHRDREPVAAVWCKNHYVVFLRLLLRFFVFFYKPNPQPPEPRAKWFGRRGR